MTLPIPLTVRLRTSRADEHVLADVRDLTIRWTDPGGYASCQVSLDRPLTLQPDEIAYYGQMTVHDGQNGNVVWDGRLEDPGRSAGDSGQVWSLAAVGGQAHAKDRIIPLIYINTELGRYDRADSSTQAGGTNRVGADPGNAATNAPDAIVLQFQQGMTVGTNALVAVRNWMLMRSGQKLARFDYTWDAGRTDTNFELRGVTRVDGSATGESVRITSFNTAGGGLDPWVIGTDWPVGRNTLDLRIQYLGTTGAIGNDTAWASVVGPVLMATRYDTSGNELLTGASYTSNTILASDVVADLLGRLLPQFDGPGATIATTTYQIDQLSYPDGTDAARVLADLMTLESGFTWRAWERNSAGKYRFEWVPDPTSVRYEADVVDGYDSQGSSDGLYNQVMVRWKDASGDVQTTIRTATVPTLDAAGLIRQGAIDLGTDAGSLAAAQQAGDQWLADRKYPPNAGRLRIARPILDMQTGRMVMPWEIRPGLIRVRGILPRVDALNATARDGVTIFRIVAAEFRVSDGAATLELDSYAPSTARLLAAAQVSRQRTPARRN